MVLLARRGPGRKHAGKWEFPGGRAEAGRTRHAYDFGEIELIAHFVMKYTGELKLTDHDKIVWVESRKLLEYDLAPADVPIAEVVAAHRRRKRYKSTHPRSFEEKY